MFNLFVTKKAKKKTYKWKITDKRGAMITRHYTKAAALTAAKGMRNVKVVPYKSTTRKRRY